MNVVVVVPGLLHMVRKIEIPNAECQEGSADDKREREREETEDKKNRIPLDHVSSRFPPFLIK